MNTRKDTYPAENVGNARALRKRSTEAEKLLWKHLRMRQVGAWKFRRQQPIGEYIVDFVCLDKKLIIEVDGGQHTETKEYDNARAIWLQARGYRILRYWNHEVLKAPQVILKSILAELEIKD